MEQVHSASGGESIKVFVRVRPPDPNLESNLQQGVCLEVTSDTTLTVNSKPDPKVFTFDHVAKENITQEDVFSAVGRPTIDSCMHGYNGTIFAYGQTGSGKTFTMIGPPSEDTEDTFTHELRGIIPRSFEYLFSLISRNRQKYGDLVEFLCKCSFLEIYNEQVFDLLDPASCGLHLRENMKHGVYVDGLTETSVASAKEAYQVLSTGWVNRKVASTSMNRESSRSHAVFTLTVESKKRESKDAVAKIRTSLLNLVDLAGSERQRDTHAAGLRLKEAGSINKSLSALGNVIMALVDIANGKTRHVHYRDSKLTFLLRDSLGGNAKTNLVANVHPSARCFGESLSTLNFARRAKMIRNKAVVNEDTSGNVLQLQAEIKRLKGTIERLKSQAGLSVSGVSQLLSPSSSPPSPPFNETRAQDEKVYRELKAMLAASMEARDVADTERNDLLGRVTALQELCNKKDKFLQSTKMILKFREAHISNLEKNRKAAATPTDPAPSSDAPTTTSVTPDTTTTDLLRQEIEQLKYLVDHHPDGSRLTRENMNLKTELKQLRASAAKGGAGGQSSARQLEQSHRYTLQLEKQLRHYLARGNSNNSGSPSLAPTTPTKMTFDLESLQQRCKHLQEELERTRRSWSSEREESRLRESKLEANLSAARKANSELERSLEALKLRNNVERETLNDIHMATIKTILTPRRDRDQLRNRSMSFTPSSGHIRRADSDPARHPLAFKAKTVESASSPTDATAFPPILESPSLGTPPHGNGTPPHSNDSLSSSSGSSLNTSTPQAKKPRLSKTPALETNPTEEDQEGLELRGVVSNGGPSPLPSPLHGREGVTEEGDMEGDLDGLNIQGALTDELKALHGRNRGLQQQLEALERRAVHLTQSKGALEAQVQEITQLARLDREGYYEKEQEYLVKIADLASQIADIKSTNEVLSSEVHDLRVCLKSADKELREVKEERVEEKRRQEAKMAAQLHKIGELEQLWSAEESKYNRAMEELQNLQDEVETVREELTFKDHRLLEMEEAVQREKESGRAQEEEVQSLLDKLTLEVEKNTRLSQELQEGKNGSQEYVALVNENSRLRGEIEKMELDLQTRLHAHKQQMERAESSLNSLLQRQSTDEAAIAGLVATVQELRGDKVQSSAKVTALQRDLEESGRELTAAVTKGEELRSEVAGLKERLSENDSAHKRELAKKEAEREIILDDLEGINDQYQRLNTAFETQGRELAATKAELREKVRELEDSEGELKRLLEDKLEKRASMSRGKSLEVEEEEWLENSLADPGSEEEIEQLKRQLDQASSMLEGYDRTMADKNSELQQLKEQLAAQESLRAYYDTQQVLVRDLRDQLDAGQEREAGLEARLGEVEARLDRLQEERVSLVNEREKAVTEGAEFRRQWESQEELVTALREQIERFKASEESLFQEKESIRSQLEMMNEERAKLSKECEKLAKENAAITGHQNIRQKIQYHATVKVENAKLKEEVIQLHSRLRRKAEQVDKLQCILSEKGLERHLHNKKQQQQQEQPASSSSGDLRTLKENNYPPES